jgi:hypothetical protein
MPKRSKGTGFRYRDSKTGRLVSKSTWKRSKAQGGKRYKRERQSPQRSMPEPGNEYQINVKYKPSEKSTKVEVQISAQGPKGASREQVISAVEYRRKHGQDKKGWEVNIVEWKKGTKKFKSSEGWETLGFFVNQASKSVKGAK